MRLPTSPSAALLLALLLAMVAPGPAGGQVDPLSGEDEIVLRLVDFGVGNTARPGEWAGLRIELLDRGDRQREVTLRVTVPDADGDRAQYERTVATNPGQRQETWVYCRLPFQVDGALGGELLVTAHAAVEGAGEREFRAGRRLGSLQARRGRLLARTEGLVGLVGTEPLGLLRFEEAISSQFQDAGHEPLRLTQRLTPLDLPDRAVGLMQFQALLWTNEPPQRLTADQADALRTWIQWGGRLIVVVPPVGETWSAGPLNNPLADIVPRVRFQRRESVDLEPLRALLTAREASEAPLPSSAVVHTFAPLEGAAAHEARCIIADREGACIVVSRRVGLGEVALIGVDITGGQMRRYALPDADIFWNRILGRRGELITREERSIPGGRMLPGSRPTRILDSDIADEISEEGQAAAGVLLGFVVFIAYWIVAGPGLYAVLRRTKRTSHAWLGFVAAALAFTIIAWGGAALIKTRSVRASHVSVIDHVYGEPFQRTRTWVSVLTPWYGEATVRLGGDETGRQRTLAAIAPWSGPQVTLTGGFPDARGYTIAGDVPAALTYPARSTIKELVADWLGDPVWTMPRPVAAGPEEGDAALALNPGGMPSVDESAVYGALRHNLPGPLEDVLVIVVHQQRDLGGLGTPTRLISDVSAFAKAGPWAPGEPLDLVELTRRRSLAADDLPSLENWADERVTRIRGEGDLTRIGAAGPSFSDQLTYASILSQLIDPASPTQQPSTALLRESLHGFDLGRWFTRPCVIVIGHLGASSPTAPSPTPIEVDGRRIEPKGRTMVRWVYPAPAAPPAWRPQPAFSPVPAGDRDLGGAGGPGRR
ncbi:MAG: DUF4350 domain-containing protein [Phycisphaerales bacterium JB039]